MNQVFSQMCRETTRWGYIIPSSKENKDIIEPAKEELFNDENFFTKTSNKKSKHKAKKAEASAGPAYQGATVIEACTGLYYGPIATLDFASLYPSIMIAYNLSYETLVKDRTMVAGLVQPEASSSNTSSMQSRNRFKGCLKMDEVHIFNKNQPSEAIFLKKDPNTGNIGFLPSILNNLLAARKAAKREMAQTKDPVQKRILNGRQLALKISCNSIYGFCGALAGYLPCIPIAATVTFIGRGLIDKTKYIVENHYTLSHGYEGNAKVVYGDTDSVMIKFAVPHEKGPNAVARAFELAKDAAERVTSVFPSPVKLEFEKVYRYI